MEMKIGMKLQMGMKIRLARQKAIGKGRRKGGG